MFPDYVHIKHHWKMSILDMFGIDKLMSNVFDGMSMCIGDGVIYPRSKVMNCSKYQYFNGMGYYALLLMIVRMYVGK
jgi:hypothetical protein